MEKAETFKMTDLEGSARPGISGTGIVVVREPTTSYQAKRFQKRIYLFLEWPNRNLSLVYHILLCLTCLAVYCIGVSCLEHDLQYLGFTLAIMEIILNVWILVDFALRFWSSSCRRCFQGLQGKLRFCSQFLSVMDIITILFGLLIIIFGMRKIENLTYASLRNSWNREPTPESLPETLAFTPEAIKFLLFFHILRMFKFVRILDGSKIFISVLKDHSQVLLTIFQIGMVGFLIFPLFVFLADMYEGDSQIQSYASSLWWSVITLTIVGYGDITPIGKVSKMVGGFAALFGVIFFIMPAAVIASGILQKLDDMKTLKRRSERPAAALIQAQWRMKRHSAASRDNIKKAILTMKLLAAREAFKGAKETAISNQPIRETGRELLCSLESRAILLEKSFASIHTKLDQLLQ